MSQKNEIIYSIWLSLALGAGAVASEEIFARYGYDCEAVWRAPREELEGIRAFRGKRLEMLADKSLEAAGEIYEFCLRENIGLLPVSSPLFPDRLRQIRSCPALLYYKGKLPDIDRRALVAAVGTRKMTEYGKRCAYEICYDLARAGAIVTSGMALGIDSVCHRAALDAGGHTIAVFGCGIDRCYPPQSRDLMNEIIARGTLFSEFAPGTEPHGYNFPIRNRIISGLSVGTLVVEADMKSGAMITANTALMQGRDMFSLPGNIGEINSLGTNKLIKDGARIVTSAADILEEYKNFYPSIDMNRIFTGSRRPSAATPKRIPPKPPTDTGTEKNAFNIPVRPLAKQGLPEKGEQPAPEPARETAAAPCDKQKILSELTELQVNIYRELAKDGVTCDMISERLSIQIGEVLANITILEIKELVRALPGGTYALCD